MKLISMTEFVLNEETNVPQYENFASFSTIAAYKRQSIERIFKYAKFLYRPLNLGMFVPCDEDGKAMREPQMIERRLAFDEVEYDWDLEECAAYKAAKDKVLFEGFEWNAKLELANSLKYSIDEEMCFDFETVEQLLNDAKFKGAELTLTPTAITSIYKS